MNINLFAKEISQHLKLNKEVVESWLNNHYRNSSQLVNTVCRALSNDKTSMIIAIMNNEKLA